jgi:hypothetical protein
MCTRFWNLKARFVCPSCGETVENQLQTHWLGDDGSCIDHYAIGERAWELRGILSAIVDGTHDNFSGHCERCDASIDFGARVLNEAVVDVWPLAYRVSGSPERIPVA